MEEARALQAFLTAHSAADIHVEAAVALVNSRSWEEAVDSAKEALALDTEHAWAWGILGTAYMGAGKPEEAIESLTRSLAIDADKPVVWQLLANLLAKEGRWEELIEVTSQAIGFGMDEVHLHIGLSFGLLSTGDYFNGLREYEWRLQYEKIKPTIRKDRPIWSAQNLLGRSILLQQDGSACGDVIQMARYVRCLGAAGAHVVCEVSKPMVRVLATMDGVREAILYGEPAPVTDYWCPLGSLPVRFDTRLDTIPRHFPYLGGVPADVERWRARLSGDRSFKVGLVWGASIPHGNWRTVGLSPCIPLFEVPGIKWYSLQVGGHRRELKDFPETPIEDLSSELIDFAEAAAVIQNLDLVISVDTAAAHLACAVGAQTWVMLPFAADWRWGPPQSERSPWYPAARLFWQPTRGDWDSVIRNIAAALVGLTAGPANESKQWHPQ